MVPELRLGIIALVNSEVDGSIFTFGALEILIKAFEAWLIAQESEYEPILPGDVENYEGDYYLYGTYEFTIKTHTINGNEWLMIYSSTSGLYGQLVMMENDETNSTYVVLLYVDC